MKITMTFLTLFVLLSPITPAQEYTRWALPESAVARLGKGGIEGVLYSSGRGAACCSQFDRYLAL